MGEHSKISWTTSTFNPWIGCTRVGPGCDHCYAEALDKRARFGGAVHWGAGVSRFRTSASNWKQPLAWEKKAAAGDKPWRVFCASLADVFDNEVPVEWRLDLWSLIEATPNLYWLLVTKRISNVCKMVPRDWIDGGDSVIGTLRSKFPDNIRLLITVCNQEEADRDIPKLLALPCKNGISYEPALGSIDFNGYFSFHLPIGNHTARGVEWIIVGGESTQVSGKARPFVHGWARDTIRQCRAAGVPVFIKQMGSNATNREGIVHPYKDRAGADPDEWPADLRVQQFPKE